jgi:RNA polymerase sigma-70 factor (ECF subfamily)
MRHVENGGFIHRAVENYSDMIIRIVFQYAKNKADAEDIMQEVFLSLMKKSDFHDEQHLKAWLIRVTINKSKDFLRHAKIRLNAWTGVRQYGFSEEDIAVMQEVSKLSDTDRDIIYLFYYEGYSAKEIAGILRKRENAVHVRLSRARDKLKNLLGE